MIFTPNASELFNHSLQNNPSNIRKTNGDQLVETIKNSNQFNNKLREKIAESPNKTFVDEKINIVFIENKDLLAAIHNIDFIISGTVVDGSGCLSITASDEYNFEFETKYTFLNLINNIANAWEEIGWVNNYMIYLDFDYCLIS